jgi:hypothetical protein
MRRTRRGQSCSTAPHLEIEEQVLIDVTRRYPAEHYVMVDDKLRMLAAIRKSFGNHVTTIFPKQGKFANNPKVLGSYPSGDVTIERISDLLSFDLHNLLRGLAIARTARNNSAAPGGAATELPLSEDAK